ncbi:hypothetical protein N3K66_000586 [Trichothecium roseum]|uniref:Uncharacterized protein n=1 Tax=Trichothecium roseum TaxID=47278 RepID=A0ACC0VDU8_9HYPO|nr:hypothetical protein N3K66_000586 [Trichothecium roseum]
MSSKIPPLLEPYLALPPEAALVLVTNVLGASSNWLVLRFLYSYLRGLAAPAPAPSGFDGGGTRENDVGVVLVSFMRDGRFWRDGAGRMGLDLDAMGRNGRFAFVDGLAGLFTGRDGSGNSDGDRGKDTVLTSSRVEDVRRAVGAALGSLRAGRKVLVVDQADVWLAASGDDVPGSAVSDDFLLPLRELAHSTVLTMAADDPLVSAQSTSLETEHAALVLGQAHAADLVVALRMLDTGAARDVSGVVRVTAGHQGYHYHQHHDGRDGSRDGGRDEGGREFLYHVAGDGGVRVFERGT